MTVESSSPTIASIDDIEALFINNPALLQIQAHLNKFNPIKTMKMERREIQHSAILAWLLDPSETHGLEDLFLKGFLSEALRGQSALGSPTALEVSQANMRDATVRTEWKNIDILIISERNEWVFIVENKFDSSQRDGQLADYAKKVQGTLVRSNEKLKVRGVFLTLLDEEPQDPQYAPINYAAVSDLLSSLMALEANRLSPEVTVFLSHYLEILKDATGMNESHNEMQKLAKQLYRDHKRVLDFVFEFGATTDFALATQSIFGEAIARHGEVEIDGEKFVFDRLRNNQVGFLPIDWYTPFQGADVVCAGCENWWAGVPLVLWVQFQESPKGGGKLTLVAEVGPMLNHSNRSQLIELIRTQASTDKTLKMRFQNGAEAEGKKYSRFFRSNTVDVKDVNDPDEISREMLRLLKKFRGEFRAVAEIIPQFLINAEGV